MTSIFCYIIIILQDKQNYELNILFNSFAKEAKKIFQVKRSEKIFRSFLWKSSVSTTVIRGNKIQMILIKYNIMILVNQYYDLVFFKS